MTPQKLKWILVASLILNVFLVGGLAGGAYRLLWSEQAPLANKIAQRGLRFVAEDLSSEQRRSFQKLLRETRREARPLIASAREARVEVRKLVAAPSFDREAVTAAIARTREADVAVRMRVEQALISFAEALPAEDRQKLADGLARRGPLRQQPELAK